MQSLMVDRTRDKRERSAARESSQTCLFPVCDLVLLGLNGTFPAQLVGVDGVNVRWLTGNFLSVSESYFCHNV